jgi:hypothetical protein
MANDAHTYRYLRPSTADVAASSVGLATAGGMTATGPVANPYFYTGFVIRADIAAVGMLAVANVATARYYQPRPTISRDPVVTCDGERLRFESFSSCCGVYARLDMLSDALDGQVRSRGTTNVDVNSPLRDALVRVGGSDPMHLAVGADELAVATLDGSVVEKKVPLPERWLRGFAEVQSITAPFDLRAELSPIEATRFLRSLPTGFRNDVLWVVPAGRTLRQSTRPTPGAVCLSGSHRLEALRPLLRFATALRVYGPTVDARAGAHPVASAWELALPGMRLVLTLSPEPNRGFSGEGSLLDALATDEVGQDAELVGAMLNFEPRVEVDLLVERCGLPPDRVKAALAQLGTAGRVGFDVTEAAYFHRELPYSSARIEAMNPRLRNARALLEAGAVKLEGETATVHVEDRVHRVRFGPDGRVAGCTCPWWTEYRGTRGKCKHALAAELARRGEQEVGAERKGVAAAP